MGADRAWLRAEGSREDRKLLLEAELNEPLFWRIKRKVKITPAGEAVARLPPTVPRLRIW